jgi:hypothetical protein
VFAAGHEDEAIGEFFKLTLFDRASAFRGTHLHSRGEAAEVLIAATGFGQEGITAAVGGCQLCADVRMDARFFRRLVELRPP